jgi:hypothetical protein
MLRTELSGDEALSEPAKVPSIGMIEMPTLTLAINLKVVPTTSCIAAITAVIDNYSHCSFFFSRSRQGRRRPRITQPALDASLPTLGQVGTSAERRSAEVLVISKAPIATTNAHKNDSTPSQHYLLGQAAWWDTEDSWGVQIH